VLTPSIEIILKFMVSRLGKPLNAETPTETSFYKLSAPSPTMSAENDTPMILLVEDCDDDAFFFTRTFQKSGVPGSVHHVTDGSLAVDYLQKASQTELLPSIVFVDLKMPMMNGFEVLEWMKTERFFDKVPVVVVSGSNEPKDRHRALELGASDYLVKPVRVAELVRVLSGNTKMGANSSPSGGVS
jgi:CheY-like chemotaxis protein